MKAGSIRIATNFVLRHLKRKRLRQFVRLEDRESLVVAGLEEQTEITYEEIGTVLLMSSEAVRKRVILSADKFRGAFTKILLPVVSGVLSA